MRKQIGLTPPFSCAQATPLDRDSLYHQAVPERAVTICGVGAVGLWSLWWGVSALTRRRIIATTVLLTDICVDIGCGVGRGFWLVYLATIELSWHAAVNKKITETSIFCLVFH